MAENSSRLEEESACDSVEDTSCGSYCGLCARWSLPHGYDTCEEEQEAVVEDHQNWLLKELKKKVKALPEILMGPKWKTCFARRLRVCSGWRKKKKRRMQFQYDPKSYALNFDDGKEKEQCDGFYLDFSARYACPVGINKLVHLGLGAQ